MSAFQVSITPNRVKNMKVQELRTPIDVVMAPFAAKSIVQFDGVPVTKVARRVLRIINPTDDCITVAVTKELNPDHNVSLSWTECIVGACDEVDMEMVWQPKLEVACMETLQLTDNRNFRKDVSVILKSKSNKPTKVVRKFPTVSSGVNAHGKTMRLKSPKGAKKLVKSGFNQQRKRSPSKNERRPNATNVTTHTQKTNTAIVQRRDFRNMPLSENNVYIDMCFEAEYKEPPHTQSLTAGLDECDQKENISPTTPSNMLSIIDKMKFTPTTETLSKIPYLMDLATLPTPVSSDYDSEWHKKGVRPRRLTAVELSMNESKIPSTPEIRVDIFNETLATSVTVSNNKTFDVKRMEATNVTNMDTWTEDSHNTPGIDSGDRTTIITCTPYSRPLEIIREEDSFCAAAVSEKSKKKFDKTYNKSCCCGAGAKSISNQNLKRDIVLVGSPLRKYSESMVELTIKSPSKICIQGSMPNLNEMESIQSIEQNRYFHQSNSSVHSNSQTSRSQHPLNSMSNAKQLNVSIELLNSSDVSLTSNIDGIFNHNEILAQSSRFNLNELCTNSRKVNPYILMKVQADRSPCKNNLPCPKTVSKDNEMVGQKRKSFELSLSDSPSMDSLASVAIQSSQTLKPPKSVTIKISPPKRQRIDSSFSFTRSASILTPTNASAARNKSWSHIQPKKLKLSKTLSLVKKPITPNKIKEEPRIKLYDTDYYLQSCINPDPFAATMTCDPFLASTMYLDERAVDRHQIDFKKWLNALVSLPPEFDTDSDTKIDVGKLFTEVRHKQLQLAPTKEEQSLNYLTQFRLDSLRRAAVQLYMSEAMRVPCSKVVVYVNKNALQIRSDRNLHLDVVMQRYILELLLCFSPLWLRLGLEVVYGEKIHLQSNSDIVGLSTFILNRLFRDKFLEQKYSRAYALSDEYATHIKKFTLQKFLLLLLFLDKAKEAHIIRHNPCLFVKKSPFKETKEILLKFSSELLANIGDITRDLKRLGYVLQHKQVFLDEYDYAFKNLAVDLRDGIRLTRVMEVILLRDDLSRKLRVPAISRLQRVYNVNLALRALAEADFQLCGDISAADIVDGHREKTLSLLWQIIYKFRSPKFHAAARLLQLWWRRQWLKVIVNRRICQRIARRRETAAIRIQAIIRGFITRRFTETYRVERSQAAVVLQKNIRRYLAQRKLRRWISAATSIQMWYRNQREAIRCRMAYIQLQNCVVFLQRCYRRRLMSVKLLAVANLAVMERLQRKETAARCIQQRWRAYLVGKQVRMEFQRQHHAAITLQRYYRAKRICGRQQQAYANLKRVVIIVQRRFRANMLMLKQRKRYQLQRTYIVTIQHFWRATLIMRSTRTAFIQQRNAAIVLQRRWRETLIMRKQRAEYKKKQNAACVLQQRWRSLLVMRIQRQQFLQKRECIIRLQQKWRATMQAHSDRSGYLCLRSCTIVMQNLYRGKLHMRFERAAYHRLRAAAIILQRRLRATLSMRVEHARFIAYRNAALTLQSSWRAYKQMRYVRAKYQGMRAAVICLQQHWRAVLCMRQQRTFYLKLRNATFVLQHAWRATQLMQNQREYYHRLRRSTICVQQRYRATLKMRMQKLIYQRKRTLIITLQIRWRSIMHARRERRSYKELRTAITVIQQRFRAIRAMRSQHIEYQHYRRTVVQLQRRWRALKQMQIQHAVYKQQREAAIRIQCWYRSMKVMCSARALYERQRSAAIVLQQRYRAHLCAQQVHAQYLLIRSLIVYVQRKYRARIAMRIERSQFLTLRYVVIRIQQLFRGRVETQRCSAAFQQLRQNTLQFQSHVRGYLARQRFRALMTPEMVELLRQKRAVRVIQRIWRGYRVRKRLHDVRIALIRKNLIALRTTASTVNSIKHKLQYAVHFLRGRFNVSESLMVLMQLERLSRTVPHFLMEHSSFISSFCYGIMSQAIRSEIDKQMIGHCSCIILNMARYNSTTANTFQRGGLTTIAQMLLRWCDKDTNIFNTLCTLIWVFAHCAQKRKIIREFMTTTEAIYFIRETKKFVARKEKMDQNRQRSQQQNQRKVIFSSRSLPSLEPDYGIICNRPYTFISSVYAFDMVLLKLDIKLY